MKVLMGTTFAGSSTLVARALGIPEKNVSSHEKPSDIFAAYHQEKFDVILLGGKLGMGFTGSHIIADLLHRGCTTPIIAVSSDPVMNRAMQNAAKKYHAEIFILDGLLDNLHRLGATIDAALAHQ